MTIVSCVQKKLEHINPDKLMSHKAFSQVVKVNASQLVFVSGQVAFDVNGKLTGLDFDTQLRQSLMNVAIALSEVSCDWQDVIQMKIYVVDLRPEHRFLIGMALDELYEKDSPPVSTLLGVQSLARRDLKVEVEVIAAVN